MASSLSASSVACLGLGAEGDAPLSRVVGCVCTVAPRGEAERWRGLAVAPACGFSPRANGAPAPFLPERADVGAGSLPGGGGEVAPAGCAGALACKPAHALAARRRCLLLGGPTWWLVFSLGAEVKLHLQAEIEPVARGSLNILEGMLLPGKSILVSLTCLPPSSSSPPGGGPGNPRHTDLGPVSVPVRSVKKTRKD